MTESWESIRECLDSKNSEGLRALVDVTGSGELARAVSRLSEDDRALFFELLGPEEAAKVIEELPDDQAADIVEDLPESQAAEIVEEMGSDTQADILGAMPEFEAIGILEHMDPQDAEEARQLLSFDPDTAGGLMRTEYLSFPSSSTVKDILRSFEENSEEYSKYEILYAYIVGAGEELEGVLRFRDLLLKPRDTAVNDIMLRDPLSVKTLAGLEDLEEIFDRHEFFAVPVVNDAGQMMGVLRRTDVREALESRADKNFLRAAGILGGEEYRSMAVWQRVSGRFPVLVVNIGLNLLAVSVIAAYEETIAAVIALAVFLPVISDSSGSTGAQAVAVSIRELALGLIRPHEFWRIFWKESSVGLILGILLGIGLGLVVWVWTDNGVLGVILGSALALNTFLSTLIGGSVPLLLKRLGVDPAMASNPLLTTVTDVSGFFVVLSLASLFLSRILSASGG